MTVSSSGRSGRVLYVDPDDDAAGPVLDVLGQAAFAVEHVRDAATARERLNDGFDCVVSTQDLPDGTGLDLLGTVREADDEFPFVLFPDEGDERLASEAISVGVSDYVPREPAPKQRLALVDAVERVVFGSPEFPAVSEQLKDRAMDEAPVGITIADASRRDMPLIYVNDAFEELTEYTEADSLARNCSFLQGDDSDRAAVAEMSRALGAGDPVSVEIKNYTKSGEPFWNRVDIAPVHEDGELTHYVGFQLDVTERVEAEREARRQAEKARAERETVEALLARLDGLVTDVTSGLLGAGTRSAVEAAVCDRLVETGAYAVAWIGDRDPATDTITPSTWAGGDDPEGFVVDLDDGGPVARAVETGELQVVAADGDGESEREHERETGAAVDRSADGGTVAADEARRGVLAEYADVVGEDVAAVAALPLQYGDVGYGVLVVALRAGARLSQPERRVLSAVGTSTAMALHDLTSQRLLASDDVIELEFALNGSEPFFVGLSGVLGASFGHVGTVARDDGPTTLFFESDADPDAVAATLEDRGDGTTVTAVTTGDDRSILEFVVESSPLFDLLSDRGGRVTDMHAAGGAGQLTLELPPEAQPREVVETIEEAIPGADLTAYREHERPAETRQDVRTRIDERLTDRQETALQTAIVGGFFEWPRDSTGEELATTMDIGRSTFHQHLRAAQRKVFEELYG